MMGRKKARKTVEEKTHSWGDLMALIEKASRRGGQSAVNPIFTLGETCEIYRKGIEKRDPEETPDPWRYDVYKERDVHSADFLIVVNILRDCG